MSRRIFGDLTQETLEHLRPKHQARSVATILAQLEEVVPDGVELGDIVKGWCILSSPKAADEPGNIANRRAIYVALASLCMSTQVSSDLTGAIRAWEAWRTHYLGLCAKERQSEYEVMARTLQRELLELKAARTAILTQ